MTNEWLISTLGALPSLLWMVAGLGLPYALLALPRRDWRQTPLVAALALAFGPALLTAWMFVPGTLGMDDNPNPGATNNPMQTIVPDHVGGEALLTPAVILAGTAVIALVGWLLVWRKWRTTPQPDSISGATTPLFWDERLLIALIVIATVGRWFVTSMLSFGSWDPLWVYGYQGKLYTLIGYIPADIGYYPQFLSLQYAYTQIMTGGVSDHAARAVMPLLQIGSILAAYALGRLNYSRRVGIVAAALWALYPHFVYWTRIGDLEIPQTFTFTLAAAFFLAAWHIDEAPIRRRYAIIAGLALGIALWTKPTAGALVWGVMLVVGVQALIPKSLLPRGGEGTSNHSPDGNLSSGVTGNVFAFLRGPRFEVAFLMGLATIPLGGLWYARNIALGHAPVVFPPDYWTSAASRSGVEFGWPLLALVILLAYAYLGPVTRRPDWRYVLPGVALIAAGVLPTILDPGVAFATHPMNALEWALFVAGVALVALAMWRWRDTLDTTQYADTRRLAWALLLALPYFLTWFISYSYHYRLSFAIVPLMILPSAVILGRWWLPEPVIYLRKWRMPRLIYAAILLLVAVPGVVTTAYDDYFEWEFVPVLLDPPPGEAAIESVVRVLREWQATHDQPLHVVAPGFQRLPFAFPLERIIVAEAPRSFAPVEGATHFIGGSDAIFLYTNTATVAPFQNQLLTGLQRPRLVNELGRFEDAAFFYTVDELHLERRFDPIPTESPLENEVIMADCARLVGYTVDEAALVPGAVVPLTFVWEALRPCEADYSVYLHLYTVENGADDGDTATFIDSIGDGPIRVGDGATYYSTLFFDPGETIADERVMTLPADVPPGDLRVVVGFYQATGGQRASVTIDGESAGEGYTLLEIAR